MPIFPVFSCLLQLLPRSLHINHVCLLSCFGYLISHTTCAVFPNSYIVATFQVPNLEIFQGERRWVSDQKSLWLSQHCIIFLPAEEASFILVGWFIFLSFFFLRLVQCWLNFTADVFYGMGSQYYANPVLQSCYYFLPLKALLIRRQWRFFHIIYLQSWSQNTRFMMFMLHTCLP